MNQLIVDPGHLLHSYAPEKQTSVSILDKTKDVIEVPRRTAVWPVVVIGLGGIATLAWNGFLIWHTARTVIGWVAGDL